MHKHTPHPREAGASGKERIAEEATITDAAPAGRAFGAAVVRISDAMAHVDRYAFKGVSRLARDAGLSPSSVSRLINGKQNPSFLLVARLTAALERTLGRRIDPRELVAEDGAFPTSRICALMGCAGCLPENALDEFGDTKPAFAGVAPGEWVASRHPRGYDAPKSGGGKEAA